MCVYIYKYVNSASLTVSKADLSEPGEFSFRTVDKDSAWTALPVWGHVQQQTSNICWLKYLGQSNRQRLYQDLCRVVVRASVLPAGRAASQSSPAVDHDAEKRMAFKLVKIAGDGLCGWRGLLACKCLDSFQAVPRTLGWVKCSFRYTRTHLLCGYLCGFKHIYILLFVWGM